jgi:hypothetical protein
LEDQKTVISIHCKEVLILQEILNFSLFVFSYLAAVFRIRIGTRLGTVPSASYWIWIRISRIQHNSGMLVH